MREILFRAKAVNRETNSERRTDYKNGDWVFGLISREYDQRFPNLPAEMTDKAGVTGIEVDYQSIGEYTGLNDKCGARIFEGDIVTCNYFCGVVFFYEGAWCVSEKDKHPEYLYDLIKLEVIGNIYDNHELLEETK